MMSLAAAPLPSPNLRSLRELYLAITGDYTFQGKLQPELPQFANATTSTLPKNRPSRNHRRIQSRRWYSSRNTMENRLCK